MNFYTRFLGKKTQKELIKIFREYLRQGRGRSLKVREEHTGRHNNTSDTPILKLDRGAYEYSLKVMSHG